MGKPLMFIDFETQSEIDIKKCGSYQYVRGVDFRPVCMAWKIYNLEEMHLWTLNDTFPINIMRQCTLLAYNVEFEYNVLKSKWFEYQDIDTSWVQYDSFIDVQALARLFGYPAKLEQLAKALDVKHQKDAKGTKLINQLCKVKHHRALNYEDSPAKFQELFEYCRQDIRTTIACYDALIKKNLSEYEEKVFIDMMKQNARGFPVDIQSVRQISRVLADFKERCNAEIYKLTGGVLTKGTQTQAMAKYIQNRGFKSITSVAAPVIEKVLTNNELDKHSRKLLKLRKMVSHSSTAKFERIKDMMQDDERVRGNLKYYGGHTGRFGGVGVQIHNLPRAQFKDPESVIQDFYNLSLRELTKKYGNLGATASKLIRPMIMAPPGKQLVVADYISVENVCLHWVANDVQTIKEFANQLDQYKTYAARRFRVAYEDVTKEQRNYAKPCVLGLGYGGGAGALQRVALGYGINLSTLVAEEDKKFYRYTFPMIPKLWYKVNSYMLDAVRRGTILELHTGTCRLRFIGRRGCAFIILPSNRFLAYPDPQIQRDAQYDKPCLTYMGVDSNHQYRRMGDQHRVIKGEVVPDMPVHGGRLVENIIQAIARDLLVNGTLWADKMDYNVIGTVHDEIIAEEYEKSVTGNTLNHFCSVICTLPEWAEGMPLRADGYIGKRYRKG